MVSADFAHFGKVSATSEHRRRIFPVFVNFFTVNLDTISRSLPSKRLWLCLWWLGWSRFPACWTAHGGQMDSVSDLTLMATRLHWCPPPCSVNIPSMRTSIFMFSNEILSVLSEWVRQFRRGYNPFKPLQPMPCLAGLLPHGQESDNEAIWLDDD